MIRLFPLLYSLVLLLRVYSKSNSLRPLFKFGIIADVQYADSTDIPAFNGGMRRYKQSLRIFEEAVNSWPKDISCAVCLGDQLDGKTASTQTQSSCLSELLSIANTLQAPLHYCFGNHDYYTFNRTSLHKHFIPPMSSSIGGACSPDKLYYDWAPFPGWRFVLLDSYDVSLIGSSSLEHLDLAKAILKDNNPNDLSVGGGWFNNLPRDRYRYVPYNGAISQLQLSWLRSVLSKAEERNEKVVFFCHQPIYSPNKPQSVVWNSEEILEIVHSFKNTFMWIAGHDHGGQYVKDVYGLHHVVPPAPLECDEGGTAYGHIDVFEDKFVLNWTGKGPDSRSILPWPTTMNFR